MTNRAALAALALLLSTTASFADGLVARISADKIGLGDSFQLVLSADPNRLTAPPDVSALNTDYDLLGTSKSTQTQIINGARTDTVEWIITLAPRSKGHLTIPVLTAGQASSTALALDVVDQSALPKDQKTATTTRIEATVEAGSHYVQQEIPLTVRITAGQGFRGGQIGVPESADYILEQRGTDKTSQATVGGKPVTVIERDYLLRPQKSGAVTVAPFTLRGSEDDPSAQTTRQSPFDSFFGRSPFGGVGSPFDQMFNPGRDVAVRTAPLTLEVKASTGTANDWFLPAKNVQITAEWDPKSPHFRVGEAVTRHVRIQALGAAQVQLPDLAVPQVTGAKIYLEGSNAGSVDTPEGTAAVRDFTYSVVPLSGGEITLPEVQVSWFDTGAETQRTATLPAEVLTVEGGAPVPASVSMQTATPKVAPAEGGAVVKLPTAPNDAIWWIGAIFAAVAAAGVATVSRRKRGAPLRPDVQSQRKAALAQVARACADGDAKAAYGAGLAWLRMSAAGLAISQSEVMQGLPELGKSWAALEAQVFAGDDAAPWDAKTFAQDVRAADRLIGQRAAPLPTQRLPPLYPTYSKRQGA
ncbi:BatD family protein [Pseudorhodobacter sp. W20_MBD10_FR17]|uniref:BatD family protein n=1 Tax=Pseudorhodobacter sp. W20_MBD10_FR17 TaxID=3240266 RepID=UPI003F94FF6F